MKLRLDKKALLLGSVFTLFFGILVAVSIVSPGFLRVVKAVTLADPNDQFVVNTPKSNSQLSETVNIQFKLYDDDNGSPEYEIALYQPNCITKYGVIAVNDYSIQGANNVFTKAFNTDGALVDRPAAADGTYCLKVCTTLSNNGTNYSVCDLRQVTLTEKVNSVPIITSTPPNQNYILGQRFGYDVNATDTDGNTLTYTLANAPDFLQINSATGEITSRGELLSVGSFDVLVYVDDGQGGRDSQQFEIVVVASPSPILPSVTITNPGGKDIVVGDSVNVTWEVSGVNDIDKIEIFFSTDGEDWTLIESLNGPSRDYEWDFSEIPDGDYYLRIVVTDSGGNTYEDILGPFSLNNPNDEPIEDSASIIGVDPKEDSEVSSVERIEATLVPSADGEIVENTLKVFLDDEDITNSCAIQEDKLICNVESLAEGKHKVEISFEDTNGEKGQKTWFFDVKFEEVDGSEDEAGFSRYLLIFIICLIALFLIVIPWLLYSIWNSGRSEDIYDYDDYDVSSDAYDAGPAGDVNVNIDPRTDLDSAYYTEPAPTETPADLDAGFDEYAIGEGDVGGGQDFTPVEPAPAAPQTAGDVNINVTAPASTTTSGQTPQDLDPGLGEGFDENDIPDWLKGEDSSDPVDTKGQEMDIKTAEEKKEEMEGADPYSDYGLAQKEE